MTIIVHGTPAPQGSKRHLGRGVMVESSKKVKPWREAVKWAALECKESVNEPMVGGSVEVEIDFYFVHPKTGKRRPTHATKPDLDKLIRSTCDAMTDAGVYEDDSRICSVQARKHYANEWSPVPAGAVIRVERWTV